MSSVFVVRPCTDHVTTLIMQHETNVGRCYLSVEACYGAHEENVISPHLLEYRLEARMVNQTLLLLAVSVVGKYWVESLLYLFGSALCMNK